MRVYNFSAGPATIPEEVLLEVQSELLDWNGMGRSVMEISHRSKEFTALAQESEQDLRDLLSIPDKYSVLFLQGGGRSQFSMVPLNCLADKPSADYINTGMWSRIAIAEAQKFCVVNESPGCEPTQWTLNPDAAYVHYVDNETVDGIEFSDIPNVGRVPLISDMSSNILSRPIDVEKYALFYAGAQKNIGPSGVTIVVVRNDMLGLAKENCPAYFNYKNHADAHSLYNTAPTFSWYVASRVFKWLKRQGGVAKMAELNKKKADLLYQAIDKSEYFSNSVDPKYRSCMNVVFQLYDESLSDSFLAAAEKKGLCALKGHRSVGGFRASIYNAMPLAGVEKLIDLMQAPASWS